MPEPFSAQPTGAAVVAPEVLLKSAVEPRERQAEWHPALDLPLGPVVGLADTDQAAGFADDHLDRPRRNKAGHQTVRQTR
ncbi:hypothetical protein O3Q52_12185 [Streptomyces sp. ActVer]|uniref:hypothetical protein n=1 Tax=Streptomyces sp. ActVer TaxID=3014558 RepID=UPI0022B558CC|nr:hypothetical protein [Streptomyces sp. ActVer]MCZ4508951.1 hypothetical protein [Streptomyces sp. ActVer]